MNRILQHLRPCCPACRALTDEQARLEKQRIVAERLEEFIGTDVAEFSVPCDAALLKALDGDEFISCGIRLVVTADARPATLDEDLQRYAVDELRRIAEALLLAASRIESGVRP